MNILPQPDDTTCGPTSLHAVYHRWDYPIELTKLIQEVPKLTGGGTLAVLLGIDALKRGFKVSLLTFNLRIIDPTWKGLARAELIDRLEQQYQIKEGKKLKLAIDGYREFLSLGGNLLFEELSPDFFHRYLAQGIPLLTGLSATYLYSCKREYSDSAGRSIFDDIRGFPMGHFVVLTGQNPDGTIQVADPYKDNPLSTNQHYDVPIQRLIHAILIGIVTYDGAVLVVEPKHA
jgi:hypothetical protein